VGRLRKMGAESYRIVSQEINLEKMIEAFVEALNSFTTKTLSHEDSKRKTL
jgi:hypothetical protein